MNKLKRIFNQHRATIYMVIVIIGACFIGLRLLNYFTKKQNEDIRNEMANNTTQTYNKDYAVISDERIDPEIYESESNLIKQFLDYCNEQKYDAAYELLSQKCKDEMFPDLDNFIRQYGENIFNTNKNYNIQAWNSSTYRIKITDDLLSTGNSGDRNYVEEFITVAGSKLNINSFLDTITMSNDVDKANVSIKIEQASIYMDYSIMKLQITNNRETSIMLNSEDYSDNVYMLDDNNSKFVALLHELSQDEMIIEPGQTKEVSIKFDVPYSKVDDIKYLNFDNVISNYEQYLELGDSRIIQFSIEI